MKLVEENETSYFRKKKMVKPIPVTSRGGP
jgi:hypothetical protein